MFNELKFAARVLILPEQCHRVLCSISQDKFLWKGILRNLRLSLPRTLGPRPLGDLCLPNSEKLYCVRA